MEDNTQTNTETLLTDEVTEPVVEDVKEPSTEEVKEPDKVEEKEEVKVPEKYEFSLPEGVTLNESLVEEATPVFKELGLTQDQAQKLVDLQVKHEQSAYKAQVEAWEMTTQNWRHAAETDQEFGGLQFKDNLAIARKALTEFGTKELKEALDLTGTGNHPEILRFFYRVGKAISEDKVRTGGQPKTAKTAAEILFGS